MCAKNVLAANDAQAARPVKYWEIIADISTKPVGVGAAVSAIDREGRTIWIADAHRDDGRRFIVRADEILTAFLELERAIRSFAALLSVSS